MGSSAVMREGAATKGGRYAYRYRPAGSVNRVVALRYLGLGFRMRGPVTPTSRRRDSFGKQLELDKHAEPPGMGERAGT